MTIARPATGKLLKDKSKPKSKNNKKDKNGKTFSERVAEQNKRNEERVNRPLDPETGRYIEKKKAGGSLSVSADKPAWMRNR